MKKIICFISFLLSFSACKDSELNINPSDSLDSRSAITTVDDLNAAVLGAYNRMTINTYYDGQYMTAGDNFSYASAVVVLRLAIALIAATSPPPVITANANCIHRPILARPYSVLAALRTAS